MLVEDASACGAFKFSQPDPNPRVPLDVLNPICPLEVFCEDVQVPSGGDKPNLDLAWQSGFPARGFEIQELILGFPHTLMIRQSQNGWRVANPSCMADGQRRRALFSYTRRNLTKGKVPAATNRQKNFAQALPLKLVLQGL